MSETEYYRRYDLAVEQAYAVPVVAEGGESVYDEELGDELAPDFRVDTGVHNGVFAAELQIYYVGDETYVTQTGEYQNALPWKFTGRVAPERVLAEYLLDIRRNDEESYYEYFGPADGECLLPENLEDGAGTVWRLTDPVVDPNRTFYVVVWHHEGSTFAVHSSPPQRGEAFRYDGYRPAYWVAAEFLAESAAIEEE